jgi:hypothetical protein
MRLASFVFYLDLLLKSIDPHYFQFVSIFFMHNSWQPKFKKLEDETFLVDSYMAGLVVIFL